MQVVDVKTNLTGMLHGGSLNKVRNVEMALERAANIMLTKCHPIETIRVAALTQAIHDDFNQYSLPSDYRDLIDLYPQDDRQMYDTSGRRPAEGFDIQKLLENRTVSVEGSEGSKILKVNWKSRTPKTLNSMNSLTANGTWAAVGTATGLVADTIFKKSGGGSIQFDIAASGDGISNTTMDAVDMTDEDEVSDVFVWVYLPAISALTSISARWGNDLTANYWSSTAQTAQADGTAFRIGWNLIKFSWATATETGTVAPATIDSFRITFATTGAIANVRVDNIIFSIGRNFDIKYYSKYLFKSSAGTYLSRTTSDDDTLILDNDSIEIYLAEALKACAQQIEGADSSFDINWANLQLNGDLRSPDPRARMGLYAAYRAMYPAQGKKMRASYGSNPGNRRWANSRRHR